LSAGKQTHIFANKHRTVCIQKKEELKEILAQYLSYHVQDETWLANATLDDLAMKALEIHGL
jgi:hypothetical protein